MVRKILIFLSSFGNYSSVLKHRLAVIASLFVTTFFKLCYELTKLTSLDYERENNNC